MLGKDVATVRGSVMTSSGRTTRPQAANYRHRRSIRDTACHRLSPTGALSANPATRHGSSGWGEAPLVMGRGHVLIIETDGPHHRSSRRYADDRNRDLQWQRCGVPVVRLAVEDLHDDEALTARLNEEVLRHLRRDG